MSSKFVLLKYIIYSTFHKTKMITTILHNRWKTITKDGFLNTYESM
jgi:hypothetical protein